MPKKRLTNRDVQVYAREIRYEVERILGIVERRDVDAELGHRDVSYDLRPALRSIVTTARAVLKELE